MDYRVLIVLGSFTLHFLTMGVIQSFGLLYNELLEVFEMGKGDTGWIASLNTGIMFLSGPFAGMVTERIGCRASSILGSLLAAAGMACSMFIDNIMWLYFTYGVVSGLGFGLDNIVKMLVVNLHCDRRRSLAMGFAASGSGVGTVVLPIVIGKCIEYYGWRGSFLIVSGFCLQGIVFGALFKSPSRSKTRNEKMVKLELEELCYVPDKLNEKVGLENNIPHDQMLTSFKTNCVLLIKKTEFDMFILSGSAVAAIFIVPFVMLPAMMMERGLTTDQAALVMTTAGISGIFGRILIGLLADVKNIDKCILHGIVTVIGGAATIGCGFIYTYPIFIAYAVLLGVFAGTFAVLQPVIVRDIVGKDALEAAFGILTLSHGTFILIGTPAAGWISDSTGSYKEAFYFAGVLYIFGGVVMFLVSFYSTLRISKTL